MVRSVLITAAACVLAACAGGGVSRQNAAATDLPRSSFETEQLGTADFEPAAAAGEGEAERIDLLAELPPGLPLQVDNPYGDVRLRFGGYQHQVEVHGVLQQPAGAAAIHIEPNQDSQAWRLAPRLPSGAILAAGQRLDLVLFVAEGHAVDVQTENGLIEARGIKADLSARSRAGDIAVRGVSGAVQLETEQGRIEVALEQAPIGSQQSLRTRTGTITVGAADNLNARVTLATSAAFATEYSLQVQHLSGQEPNKHAQAVVGEPLADLQIDSLRGEIRLLRRAAGFVPVQAVGAMPSGESEMKRSQAP